MRYYKFDCGCVESVSVVKRGEYLWKCITHCRKHWIGAPDFELNHCGPNTFRDELGLELVQITKTEAAILKLQGNPGESNG